MSNAKIIAIHSRDGTLLQRLSAAWFSIMDPDPPTASTVAPYTLVPLVAADASRVNGAFAQTVGDADVVLVTGLSHGSDTQFTGFGGEVLYLAPSVPSAEVKGKIIHLLSCSTVGQLGTAFVGAGAAAFIGYRDLVPIDQDSSWVASFLSCDAQVDISLAQGKSVAAALQDAKTAFLANQLDYIGKTLMCEPADAAGIFLPTVDATQALSSIDTRQLPSRGLPAPNSIPDRTILRAPAI